MSEPSGGFPDLRIVPVADLLLHERVDLERVTRLIDRLSADGILKNPPIVGSLPGSERFLLLDGANRVSAIQNLDIPHLIVQVEPFENENLEIRHWNHVVRDIEARELLRKAREIERQRPTVRGRRKRRWCATGMAAVRPRRAGRRCCGAARCG